MKRLLALAALLLPVPALAEEGELIPLSEISSFFNELKTVEAQFLQRNDDGSQSTGRLLIQRPGRARFEYDPPAGALVLASGGQVAIFDDKSNTDPEQYPLRRTPLALILAKTVDLEQADMVIGHETDGETTSVIAQDPENPDLGSIQLVFAPEPLELLGWIVTDGSGSQTGIELRTFEAGKRLPSRLFSIPIEIQRRQR